MAKFWRERQKDKMGVLPRRRESGDRQCLPGVPGHGGSCHLRVPGMGRELHPLLSGHVPGEGRDRVQTTDQVGPDINQESCVKSLWRASPASSLPASSGWTQRRGSSTLRGSVSARLPRESCSAQCVFPCGAASHDSASSHDENTRRSESSYTVKF